MNYDEFKRFVIENVSQFLSDENQIEEIEEKQIYKNHVTLDALIVKFANINISPTVYMNNFFEDNISKSEAIEVTKRIAEVIKQNMPKQSLETGWLFDFDLVKNLIIPKVVGIKNNEQMLERLIYSQKADLAVTYSVYLNEFSNKNELSSIPISRNLAEKWGVSADVLEHAAKNNIQKLYSPCISDMADIFPHVMNMSGEMYVISNRYRVNGAAVFLDDRFMESVREQLQGDFYILPSSIHEMICISATNDMQIDELQSIVTDINACELIPEYRLSDHVYKYDYDRHEIYRADQEQKRQEELNASLGMRSHISR